MNRRFLLLILLSVAGLMLSCTRVKKSELPVRVMTFNIRVNVESDAENSWPHRKDPATSMIRFHRADLIGLQEALIDQVNDLADRLPDYGWIGVARDDGKQAGEFMAIFYLRDRFAVADHGTFWLSETPDQPSLGWDAACRRVVTWAQFKDRVTGKRFFHFNTHFDHVGKQARENSAVLLLQKVNDLAGNHMVVLTGDFNSAPDDAPIQRLLAGLENDPQSRLLDSQNLSEQPHHGPRGTFTQWQWTHVMAYPIDYIFVKNGVRVRAHATLSDTFDGRFPSDHMPVLAEIF